MRIYYSLARERHVRFPDGLESALERLARLEQDLDTGDPPCPCHNDLLAGNFIDDGKRLWLIDWDYAGFNSPLFDLGNLSSNNEVAPADEKWLLETYFERPLNVELNRRYHAMKCASLLRETMWSMVSEVHSTIDFDYAAYTADYLGRFERAFAALKTI